MDLAAVVVLEVLYAIASLALISVGLAVIFGMMRVINLAHGEFMMLGGYATIIATRNDVNLWLAIFVIAPLVVGVIGIVVERLLIRFLYGRMVDTMLATWGLSLFFIGLITTIFGAATEGISAPLGNIVIGRFSLSTYNIFLIVITTALLATIYLVLKFTRVGLIARGTMQNPDMAAALGVSPNLVYSATFAIGSALTGLAGALLAPITSFLPTVGIAFIAKAFITVIGGGAAVLTGTTSASTLFGLVNQIVTFQAGPVFGEVALLIAAVILLRLLPAGITGRFFKGSP